MTGSVTWIIVRALAVVVMLVHLPGPAVAQESVALDEAIARGLKHSARLAELQARQDGAAAVADARAAARLPIVAAQAGYTRTNHVDEYAIALPGQPLRVLYPDVPNNYRARLDLQWPIYTAGRTGALERAARAESRASAEDIAAARADLVLEITRAYWALVTARDTERVLDAALRSIDAHVADLRTRLDQGLISPNELLSAQARRSRERVESIEAASIRQTAEADLRRLIGGDGPIYPARIEDAGRTSPANTPLPRPERRALDGRLQAANEREAAIAAAGRPQVFLGGGYDFARPNPRIFPRVDRWEDSWDASVNLSWTLWDGGRRAAEQAEAAAGARAVTARIDEFDRQAAFELQARQLEVASSRAAIDAAQEGIEAAVEARRVIGERYRAGVATSTEVLDAEVAVLHAELDRTRAVASLRLAEARLARASGVPR